MSNNNMEHKETGVSDIHGKMIHKNDGINFYVEHIGQDDNGDFTVEHEHEERGIVFWEEADEQMPGYWSVCCYDYCYPLSDCLNIEIIHKEMGFYSPEGRSFFMSERYKYLAEAFIKLSNKIDAMIADDSNLVEKYNITNPQDALLLLKNFCDNKKHHLPSGPKIKFR